MMRAIGFRRYGGAEVLEQVELPVPEPGAGEIRIRVEAAAVNPADWRIRSGAFRFFLRPRWPFVPGSDVAGVVDAVGTGVSRFRPDGAGLERIAGWIAAGAVRPVVERPYPLADTADAHRRSETGRARGKLVLMIQA